MKTPKLLLVVAMLAAALVATLVPAPAGAQDPAAPLPCSGPNAITHELESGSAWAMCTSIDPKKGLVVEAVHFKGASDDAYRKVFDSIALSQLNVPYDSGQHQWNDITSYGFGNQYLQKMDPSECPDGEMITVDQSWTSRNQVIARSIPAICVQEVDTGLAYRSHEQDWGSISDEMLFTGQGTELVVSIISKVDWYEYSSQYRFAADGTITPRLGATGDISPEDFASPQYGWPVGEGATDHSTSHHHSAVWRVDFGLDGQSVQEVQQYDAIPSGTGQRGPLLTGTLTEVDTPRNIEPARRRWYRVLAPESLNADGHPRSYEVNFLQNQSYEGIPEYVPEVTFTNFDACQQFATLNLDTACRNQSVLSYVADDPNPLTDPVGWVNVGFHHVVRDEDQSPMPVHWQGFLLVPRDFTAQNPLTPSARQCVNGDPGGQIDSRDHCGNATETELSLSAGSQYVDAADPATASIAVGPVSGSVQPEGTVSLLDGDTTVVESGVELDDEGAATITLPSDLSVGAHELTAVFAPAAGTEWVTSRSDAVPFRVLAQNEPFVTAALTDFLGAATPEDVAAGVGALDGGTTRATYLRQLTTSDAWLGAIVDGFYTDTLGRPADEAGKAFWVDALRSGRTTVAKAAAQFYSSPEYYARVGGTDEAWVGDLVDTLLGREATEEDLAYWTSQIAVIGRGSVSLRLYQSAESAAARVEALYQHLLGRSAEPDGRSYWAARVVRDGDLALALHLALSPEYATRAVARFG